MTAPRAIAEFAAIALSRPRRAGDRADTRRDALVIAMSGLLVAAGYYAGANIGLILWFPPLTPSVLWPPNAILTAAFLLTPPHRWWVFMAAAFPAHVIAEAGWPLPLVLALFATNCSEALVGAVCVRRFSDDPTRVDTLRRVLVFVGGAAVVGPFVSSFLDAAVVTAVMGQPYWLVWRARLFSNVLTELAVAPAIVVAATSAWPWIRRTSWWQRIEAALLAMCLGVVAVAVFAEPMGHASYGRDLPNPPVALFLPIALWAAVRFGPGGVSAFMLVATLILTWAATHERGPFALLSANQSVLSLQLYLSVSIVPLMCLAGLIEERRSAGRALAERLSFEALVARLSGAFVHVPSDRMGGAFDTWLQRIGTFLSVDRVLLLRLSDDDDVVRVAHSWNRPELTPMPSIDVSADFPWTVARLVREEAVILAQPDDLPPEAFRDLVSLSRYGVRSQLVLPLLAGGRVCGALAFVTTRVERAWPEHVVAGMQLVAEVFASALARKEGEDALRASELMKSAILRSLSSGVAVLARNGRIVAVNEAWCGGDATVGGMEPPVGQSYLDVWRESAAHGEPRAVDALSGIEAVLGGARAGFTFECPSLAPGRVGWFSIAVVALTHPQGGAVVSHTDTTERKRAEIEAEKTRQELAHVTRVSAMGELTASLAHELNQPLTGILANAQAARRFLDADPPQVDEVRDILADIVTDDKRAAEVIRRVRDLMRKGDGERTEVDIDVLVREVVKLLGSDTVVRDVTVVLDLRASPAKVFGDRVQLQQVVLNLLLNGMEAVAECRRNERSICVRTRRFGMDRIEVAVEDAGSGLRAGEQDLAFEPFYSTKPTGMGMGLAIARSIIEAHSGAIAAENNPTRGATFRVTLPVAGAE